MSQYREISLGSLLKLSDEARYILFSIGLKKIDSELYGLSLCSRFYIGNLTAPGSSLHTTYYSLRLIGRTILQLAIADYYYSKFNITNPHILSNIFQIKGIENDLLKCFEKIGLISIIKQNHDIDTGDVEGTQNTYIDICRQFVTAVFIQEGYDQVLDLLERIGYLRTDNVYEYIYSDPKTKLQEITQELWRERPEYTVISEDGPDHCKVFVIEAEIKGIKAQGTSSSKKRSADVAAIELLKKLYSKYRIRNKDIAVSSRSDLNDIHENRKTQLINIALRFGISKVDMLSMNSAFCHPSFQTVNSKYENYQRLAMVGSYLWDIYVWSQFANQESYIESASIEMFYEWFNKLKVALVRDKLFIEVWEKNNMINYMLCSSGQRNSGFPDGCKVEVVQALLSAIYYSHKASNYGADYFTKTLDTFNNYFFPQMISIDTFDYNDDKTALQELLQPIGYNVIYNTISTEIIDKYPHIKHIISLDLIDNTGRLIYRVKESVVGKQIIAEKNAAREVIEWIKRQLLSNSADIAITSNIKSAIVSGKYTLKTIQILLTDLGITDLLNNKYVKSYEMIKAIVIAEFAKGNDVDWVLKCYLNAVHIFRRKHQVLQIEYIIIKLLGIVNNQEIESTDSSIDTELINEIILQTEMLKLYCNQQEVIDVYQSIENIYTMAKNNIHLEVYIKNRFKIIGTEGVLLAIAYDIIHYLRRNSINTLFIQTSMNEDRKVITYRMKLFAINDRNELLRKITINLPLIMGEMHSTVKDNYFNISLMFPSLQFENANLYSGDRLLCYNTNNNKDMNKLASYIIISFWNELHKGLNDFKIVAAILHDIKNGMININRLIEDNEIINNIDRINAQKTKILRMVISLQNYYRTIVYSHEQRINVNDWLKATFNTIKEIIPNSIDIKLLIDDRKSYIKGDIDQLTIAINNLIQNSYEAMSTGGIIDIISYADNGMFIIQISDNGPGINESIKDKLLVDLYSSKKEHGGTGLGLLTTAHIISSNNGHISITRTSPGAEFTIKLPLYDY